jgi:SAM-dependent methyltransferase
MRLTAPCYSHSDYQQYFDIGYSGLSVLDIGSSAGSFSESRWFKQPAGSLSRASLYVSLDIDLSAKPIVSADAHRLPFEDESFDVIVANNVIEHLKNPALGVAEMRRVLRPEGTILYTIPFLYPVHEAPNDYTRFTASGLRQLFSEFRSVEILPRGGLFSTIAQLIFLATHGAGPRRVGSALRAVLYPFLWAFVQLDRWDRTEAFTRVYYGKLRR